ncbi:MAG: hypothetical protein ACFE0O_10465 [Opitutales bacterium]
MWLATQHGFFSMVRKNSDRYAVRARVREDLERLGERIGVAHPIHCRPEADYRYRWEVDLEELLEILVQLGADLDYPNFMARIEERPDQRDKLPIYQDLWTALHTLQARTVSREGA